MEPNSPSNRQQNAPISTKHATLFWKQIFFSPNCWITHRVSDAALLKGTPSKALTYCMSCTNLFVVFDFIVEDNAVGSFRLLPGQGDTVSRSLLLSDDCYWWGGWWETQREKKEGKFFYGAVQWKFSPPCSILVIVYGFCSPNSVCRPMGLH